MNRPRHIAWIGFTLLLVSLASCRNGTSPDEIGDAEGELAPNPSFERGGSGPDGWTTYVNGTAPQSTFEWRQSGARTGSRSLSVTTRTADGFGWPGWRSDPIRIDSRQSYEMSIWYRTTTVASPSLEVDLFDTNGSYLRFFSVGPAGGSAESDGNWHEMKRTLDATVSHRSRCGGSASHRRLLGRLRGLECTQRHGDIDTLRRCCVSSRRSVRCRIATRCANSARPTLRSSEAYRAPRILSRIQQRALQLKGNLMDYSRQATRHDSAAGESGLLS